MNKKLNNYRPKMTDSGVESSFPVSVMDELGAFKKTHITGERPLIIYVNKQEIVTLMTLGKNPELLVLGYLHNQGFIKNIEDIKEIHVDWEVDAAIVVTNSKIDNLEKKLSKRTVTSGCGQGTVFGNIMEDLDNIKLPTPCLLQSSFYQLLHNIRQYNDVYKKSGAVHGCALCKNENIEIITSSLNKVLEEMIKRNPDQWIWTHDRWK